ncbi:hypothetical protein [Tropicibacter oceani]|uniref:Uncharacterized protein n=1 Tax=Tropicibacter oceani TaxID=3058420 RepID=A0ABY8QHC9_9RHOB|nr:hypothetical protein [Tropicibacter oceani]WGW04054.1 hypothetical protein QF118_00515 [Tropicibacter oceani]
MRGTFGSETEKEIGRRPSHQAFRPMTRTPRAKALFWIDRMRPERT